MSHWLSELTVCFPTQGASFAPWGATHTLELGLPVSPVSLQWWPWRDPWSLATTGLLARSFCGDLSHSLVSVPFSLQATDYAWCIPLGSRKAHTRYLGGGGPVELLHFSHFHHVSLVQWTNRLLPATVGTSLHPGGATHTLELGLPVSTVSLQYTYFVRRGIYSYEE